ncbi:MAG: ABC transporter substrate-binding protein [Promethearchaeota archaeon]
MTKTTKIIIYFLIGFILFTSTSIAIFNPKGYKEVNDFFNEDNSNDDPSRLNTNQGSTFTVGVDTNPQNLDPVIAWEVGSYYVIDQVCEGLFRYNLSALNLLVINNLAEEYWWEDSITLQIKLREGVSFHDDTPFNATAAKWNLDRLLYLTNCSGTLPPTTSRAITETLWRFPNGTAIINQVDVINEYNITIHLNAPFSPLLHLLSFTSAYMLSPSSTPALDYIDLSTGDLVGTGPFEYDGYIPNTQVNFHAFQNYWQGKANINEMVFLIILDPTARNNAMLSHSIDFLCSPNSSLFSSFEADPETTVTYFTDMYGIPSTEYSYLGFNNDNINLTMRKAMSYAINYTYIIEELKNEEVVRANSPISTGFGDAYNSSTYAASWNLAKARQILKDAGVPGTAGLTANNDTTGPVSDKWKAAEFATYNYTYNVESQFRSDLYVPLEEWFDQIGVTVVADVQATFIEYIMKFFLNPDAIDLFFLSWLPDYLDPYIVFDPLFNPNSDYNFAQVNDTPLMDMLGDALDEIDNTARNNIYKDIQGYLATQLYPHAFGYHPKMTYVYSANLTKYPHNALERLYLYPCEWVIPLPPPPPPISNIFIDDSDPNYNWSKTALENDWCSGSGTWNDPYVIKDIEIDGEFTYDGIEIYNSSVYFRIENCSIYNVLDGIYLSNVDNSLIYNNSIYDSSGIGIFLEHSDNHTISYNKLLNITSMYGGFSIILLYSNHSEIIHNSVVSSIGGIGSGYSFDVLIFDNDIINNAYIGITTGLAYNTTIKQNDVINNTICGIALQMSNETVVKDNLVSENPGLGIYLLGMWTGCHNNDILGNQIYNNGMIGLALDNYSSYNTILQNEFIGNTINAVDNGTLNAWDNGVIGNSWDDYIGVDADDDGIGDTPYLIDGEAGSMDNYPIFDDGPDIDLISPIIIINEPDNGDEFTTYPPIYDIEITESNLDSVWYTMDNGVNNVTITSYSGILDETLWNALPYGIVSITFYANDTAGNVGDSTVLVYKNEPTAEPDRIPGPSPILLLTIVLLGIIGLTWQRKHKLN